MLPRARSVTLIIQPRHLNDHQKTALFHVTPGTVGVRAKVALARFS
jgi:hypothetical protein